MSLFLEIHICCSRFLRIDFLPHFGQQCMEFGTGKILAITVLLGIHKALCKIQNGGGSHFEKNKPK